MALIYETENFIVEASDEPHVTRTDGGHIIIIPRQRVVNRQDLTPKQAVELMRLTIIIGDALATAMNNLGIDIGRINYQDNGNWGVFDPEGPHLHIHIYGRAKSAKIQKYGDALYFPHRETGFYDNFEALNYRDISEIKKQIRRILKKDKYKNSAWNLL